MAVKIPQQATRWPAVVALPLVAGLAMVVLQPPYGIDIFGLICLAAGIPATVVTAKQIWRSGISNAPLLQWFILGIALSESALFWNLLLANIALAVAWAIWCAYHALSHLPQAMCGRM